MCSLWTSSRHVFGQDEPGTHIRRENFSEIQVSCVASAGVEGYTCQRSGASPSFFLSSWTCRASQLPHPPSLHLPDPGQFSSTMRGHPWEFIPDASCFMHSLLSRIYIYIIFFPPICRPLHVFLSVA